MKRSAANSASQSEVIRRLLGRVAKRSALEGWVLPVGLDRIRRKLAGRQ
jgi:hypothetical protein